MVKAIHEAMREAREDAGMTREFLSRIARVPKTTLGSYETGAVTPSLYNIIALADALGLTIDEYVGHRVKDGWKGGDTCTY